ncbi:MAG: acetoin utilization protein [Arenimonas sp. SCN 70-307]|uniref:histone deacetylase family protein n=1 Tax=Arenimonas sp. SCN 70-307 TaxID=1660089 RepID=UPI0008684759|nr:histone deacetylase family protein [Arenimonas sp. SCN 70-307]ODS62900.1 MAG: acetoin utilization protein [Arenimonas sp. SCN 70-307]
MLLYTHTACLEHDPGPGHPECPARLEAVLHAVRAAFPAFDWRQAPEAPRDALLRVHTRALVESVLDTKVEGQHRLDEDTLLSPGSAAAALRAAGAGIAAVDAVMAGEARQAFCAVRPPGHHATAGTAMGFCLFNSAAVAAAHAVHAHGLHRVAIADFDVHHGNGSQAIFAGDPRVMYLSSHQAPLYPYTGDPAERGVGNLANATLAPGAGGAAFRAAWGERLLPELEAFRPQLLLVSAGFDGHRLDPLADLALEAEDYRWLGRELAALAGRHAEGRLVSMLEGGYSLAALRACSVAHLQGLLDAA